MIPAKPAQCCRDACVLVSTPQSMVFATGPVRGDFGERLRKRLGHSGDARFSEDARVVAARESAEAHQAILRLGVKIKDEKDG